MSCEQLFPCVELHVFPAPLLAGDISSTDGGKNGGQQPQKAFSLIVWMEQECVLRHQVDPVRTAKLGLVVHQQLRRWWVAPIEYFSCEHLTEIPPASKSEQRQPQLETLKIDQEAAGAEPAHPPISVHRLDESFA